MPAIDCNPYLALSAILAGGLIGMEDELEPPAPFTEMAWGLEPDAAPRTARLDHHGGRRARGATSA